MPANSNNLAKGWVPIGSVITALAVLGSAAVVWATDKAQLASNTESVATMSTELRELSKRLEEQEKQTTILIEQGKNYVWRIDQLEERGTKRFDRLEDLMLQVLESKK